MQQPTLTTERLILRPYSMDDAKELQKLIEDRGYRTLCIPSLILILLEWLKNG